MKKNTSYYINGGKLYYPSDFNLTINNATDKQVNFPGTYPFGIDYSINQNDDRIPSKKRSYFFPPSFTIKD
jgi:hypothetical protein